VTVRNLTDCVAMQMELDIVVSMCDCLQAVTV